MGKLIGYTLPRELEPQLLLLWVDRLKSVLSYSCCLPGITEQMSWKGFLEVSSLTPPLLYTSLITYTQW